MVEEEITKEDELIMAAQTAAKVQTTMATPGWREVIRPALDNMKQSYLDFLLSRKDRMEDVIFAQRCVLAVDELLGLLKWLLDEGKNAEEYFRNKGKGENNV